MNATCKHEGVDLEEEEEEEESMTSWTRNSQLVPKKQGRPRRRHHLPPFKIHFSSTDASILYRVLFNVFHMPTLEFWQFYELSSTLYLLF